MMSAVYVNVFAFNLWISMFFASAQFTEIQKQKVLSHITEFV